MNHPEPKTVSSNTSVQPYAPPAVVYEAPLEVRAGTPLGIPDLTDIVDPS